MKIQIIAIGPTGCGKSLAISDLMRGLRDARHFIVPHTGILMSSENEEYAEYEIKLRREPDWDHDQ